MSRPFAHARIHRAPPVRPGTAAVLAVLLAALLAAALAQLAACSRPQERFEALTALARWEDRRLAPADSLSRMIHAPDAHVRRAAVRAAGLIGRDDVLPDLIDALQDRSGTVREEAAFALGLLGHARALTPLARAAAGPHRGLRLAALEALAHLEHDGSALAEPALHGETREATRAWDALRDRAGGVPAERLAELIRSGLERTEPEVIWRVLRCAERAQDSTLVARLAPFATADPAQVRVHACRALGRQEGAEALAAVVGDGQDEPFRGRAEIRVRVAQLRALGALAAAALGGDAGREAALRAERIAVQLGRGIQHGDPHVARTALEATARATAGLPLPPEAAERESLLPVWRIRLARAARERLADPVGAVRAAAVRAVCAARGPGSEPIWRAALRDSSALVREAAVAAAAAGPASGTTFFGLHARFRQERGRTRAAAVTALHACWERFGRPAPADSGLAGRIAANALADLVQAAADTDFTVVATAAPLLGDLDAPAACDALLAAWARDHGAGTPDVRLAVLEGLERTFGEDGGDDRRPRAAAVLESAFDAADLRLRLRARDVALATELLPGRLIPSAASLRATLPPHERDPRQPAVTLAFAAPRVRCVTDRGSFDLELDPEAAPNTCASFLALIRAGFYDGLTFHRVVPDFVIQGGDPRGDGWGGPGYTIRSEFSRRPFERGTVGIAHAGKDSGGSQFFVTLSPQPHLNGRYTVFGRVVAGMEVADRIQPGDRFRLELRP